MYIVYTHTQREGGRERKRESKPYIEVSIFLSIPSSWKENTDILDTHSFCYVYLPCSRDCAVIKYQLLGHYSMSTGTLECTVKVLVAQSCLIFCNPVDCSLPVSTVHGILQARILEWIAIPFSRRSSRHREWTWVSHIAGRFFTVWATREGLECSNFQ